MSCQHCDAIASGKPPKCRHCGRVTNCMYDVGPRKHEHDHFCICTACFHAGVQRGQSERQSRIKLGVPQR